MSSFCFKLTHTDHNSDARVGVLATPHGDIETPAFIPVGTQGAVKSLAPIELENLMVPMFFVNSYHIYLRPGIEVIKKSGGLHTFIGWHKPLITDSGGFQAFSLGKNTYKGYKKSESDTYGVLSKVTDDGVQFTSHWDGSKHFFTPESSMQLQSDLGSDIHIAFDDCTPYGVSHQKAKESVMRTHRWATRSLTEHKRINKHMGNRSSNRAQLYQALYGSIQGSVYEDLRKESAGFISSMDFDGIAIGGVSVGETKSQMKDVLDWIVPILPKEKPRHLLGVGEIDDIFMLIEHGIDTFDCVGPTRLARMGQLYCREVIRKKHHTTFTIDITKSIFSDDVRPIDPECSCFTCTTFTRAYIHHLFHVHELLAYRLATFHNISTIQNLLLDIRNGILSETYAEVKKNWFS